MRGEIWNFCYLRRSRGRPFLTYAHSLNVWEEDLLDENLLNEMSDLSNNDLLSALITAEVSENMSSYYKRIRDSDLLALGNLLIWRNVSLEKGEGASFVRTVRTSGRGSDAKAPWPIVFRQYLYNRSTARRCG